MAYIPMNMVTNEEILKAVSIKLAKAGAVMKKAGLDVKLKPMGIIDTNMDMNHVVGRGWDLEDALRDILQNAMDEDEDVGLLFQPEDVRWHDGVTMVVDYGRGITEKAFGIGGTKTDACHRGGFGEGLKLALGTLIQYGHGPVVLATKEKVYIADRFPLVASLGSIALTVNSEWLGIIVAEPEYARPFEYGTAVLIPDPLKELNPEKILPNGETIFDIDLPPMIEEVDFEYFLKGPCMKQYRIIEGELPSAFYIGGLFMTTTDRTSVFNGNASYYSYDIWGNPLTGDIEASRRNFYETWRAVYKVYYLWAMFFKHEPEKAVESFAKIIRASMERSGKIYIVRQKVGELSMWTKPSDMPGEYQKLLKELTIRAVEKATGVDREDMVKVKLGATEISNIQNLLWLVTDKDVLVWDAEWPEPEIQDITSAIIEKAREQVQSISNARFDDSLLALSLENFVKSIIGDVPVKVHVGIKTTEEFVGLAKNTTLPDGTPAPEILVMVGDVTDGKVFLWSWYDLLDTISHETAHVLPASYGGGYTLKDMTQEFVLALSKVTAKVMANANEITSSMFLLDMANKRTYMRPSYAVYWKPVTKPSNAEGPPVHIFSGASPCPKGHRVLLGMKGNTPACLPMVVPTPWGTYELSFHSSIKPMLLLKRDEADLIEAYSLLHHFGRFQYVASPMSYIVELKLNPELPPKIKKDLITEHGYLTVGIGGRAYEVLKNLGLIQSEKIRYSDVSLIRDSLKEYIKNLLKERAKKEGL